MNCEGGFGCVAIIHAIMIMSVCCKDIGWIWFFSLLHITTSKNSDICMYTKKNSKYKVFRNGPQLYVDDSLRTFDCYPNTSLCVQALQYYAEKWNTKT